MAKVSYLRVSVTDRCNQRCVYCMPAEGVPLKAHRDILSFEEIERVVRAAVTLGVRSVRLTGGEPLVRRGIVDLARGLAAVPGLDDLSLTTNGVLLAGLSGPLRAAGVKRVNISFDTLRPDRYREITRTDHFREAWVGLEAALAAGFAPVKVNTVVIRGLNDDEVEDMALLAAGIGQPAGIGQAAGRLASLGPALIWRFIELMPLGQGRVWGEAALVPAGEIAERLARLAEVRGLPFEETSGAGDQAGEGRGPYGAGPARYFRLGRGHVGVISPMTHGFCASCNRLRLTSDGQVHPCLASPLAIDLAGPLRAGAPQAALAALLAQAVEMKPQAHRMAERRPELSKREMSKIGG
jgi:cyclic pyranopterin phosphate synthase